MTVKQKIINKSDNLFRTYGLRGVTMDNISNEHQKRKEKGLTKV